MKYSESAKSVDEASVEPEVRNSSVATFQRLQEEIIELESNKRRLRRRVDQLRDEERLLARRLEHRPRDTGIATSGGGSYFKVGGGASRAEGRRIEALVLGQGSGPRKF